MVSIIGQRIDYNGVGALKGQRHIPSKNLPQYTPLGYLYRSILCDDLNTELADHYTFLGNFPPTPPPPQANILLKCDVSVNGGLGEG